MKLLTLIPFLVDIDVEPALEPINTVLKAILVPLLALVGVVGLIYCVILGVKLAKAEDQQQMEKAKSALKNAIIGFVAIFVLIAVLTLLSDLLVNWVKAYL